MYKNNKYFKEQLESFHKIKGYFNLNSFISYKSDVIDLTYNRGEFSINWVDQYAYKRSKISYIPSERNMVILPEVRKVEFGNNNIRSFLFDWFDARKNYIKDERLSVLNLGVDYYYNENSDEDHIVRNHNGDSYDILLSNASSGLQSITPLIALIDYLTIWVYKQQSNISFEQKEKMQKTDTFLYIEKIIKPYFGYTEEPTEEQLLENTEKLVDKLSHFSDTSKKEDIDDKLLSLGENFLSLKDNLSSTHNTQFIIEEPEQNLFPETQRDLIYYLLEKLQSEREHTLSITTHSPYILYAINNCMLGGLVSSQLEVTEKEDFLKESFLSEKSWINPKQVSVWEIDNGKIRNIQDKDNIISENYFDKKMTEVISEYDQILNYYKDEDER